MWRTMPQEVLQKSYEAAQCQRLNSFICNHCNSSAGDRERFYVGVKGFRHHQHQAIWNICSSPCHLACTKLHRNDRDKLKTGGKQWTCCYRRPVSSQPCQLSSSPSRPMGKTALITTTEIPLTPNETTPTETTPTTRTTNALTERTVPSVLPIRTLATTAGCSTCDVDKRSIRKYYHGRSAANAIKKGTYNVQIGAAMNERRSVMATIAGRAVERTLGLQSCEGTILTHCKRK